MLLQHLAFGWENDGSPHDDFTILSLPILPSESIYFLHSTSFALSPTPQKDSLPHPAPRLEESGLSLSSHCCLSTL